MQTEMRKTGTVKPYDKNPRLNDGAVTAVAESIKAYGFNSPIIVDKDGVIICGHTRWKAAQQLGLEEVPVIVASHLTKKQAKAYRIADNKTSDLSIWDNKLLLEELEDLDDLFTGFDPGEMLDAQVFDESHVPGAMEDPEVAFCWEATFRSQSKEKIDRIKELWEELGGDD